MTQQLTVEQRELLAECVRMGLVGWLVTCPVAGRQCPLIQSKATTVAGFSFSKFIGMASAAFGRDYRPYAPGSTHTFPLSIEEAVALANDLELGFATHDQLHAAGQIAARCPYSQPQVRGRDWRSYVDALAALGIDPWEASPTWVSSIRDRLRPFLRAVAALHVTEAG